MKEHICVLLGVSTLMLIYFTSSADGLSCVQCNNCGANDTDITECAEDQSALCLKILHKSTANSKLTIIDRRCSNSTSSELLCSDLEHFTSCLYYCRTDGCNTAMRASHVSRKLVYGAVTAILAALAFMNFV